MKHLFALAAVGATAAAGPALTSAAKPAGGASRPALAAATPGPGRSGWEPDPRLDVPVHRVNRDTSGVSTLVLTVTAGGSAAGPSRFTVLVCDPPRGPHPRRSRACALLSRAGGDPANLAPTAVKACPRVFHPVTVTANGIWRGRYVWFERTYGNTCAVHAMTGVLFDI